MTRRECEELCRLLPTDCGFRRKPQSALPFLVRRAGGPAETVSKIAAVLPLDSRAVQCSFLVKSPETWGLN
jgi:hypothetical protein